MKCLLLNASTVTFKYISWKIFGNISTRVNQVTSGFLKTNNLNFSKSN